MYISISPQKIAKPFSRSAADYVAYLEKENNDQQQKGHQEFFFNQESDSIPPSEVIREIDGNTAKLKASEPRFYAITINPSQRELQHLQNDPEKLKRYTRELMKDYAGCFNREINNRPVQVSDIKYFGKIEYQRTFSFSDREVRENTPHLNNIIKLQHDLVKIRKGQLQGSSRAVEAEIKKLEERIPNKLQGIPIRQGMPKPGLQTHLHLIVSRKDQSNSYSLSPGSKYKASEVRLHGKLVKRGFNRDRFFTLAESRFDKQFRFPRNFVERYASRKTLKKDPGAFYAALLKLPTSERKLARQLLSLSGPGFSAGPDAKIRFALKKLKKVMETGMNAGSIGY